MAYTHIYRGYLNFSSHISVVGGLIWTLFKVLLPGIDKEAISDSLMAHFHVFRGVFGLISFVCKIDLDIIYGFATWNLMRKSFLMVL